MAEISLSIVPVMTVDFEDNNGDRPWIVISLGGVRIDRFRPERYHYDPSRSDLEEEFSNWFQRRVLNPEVEEDDN